MEASDLTGDGLIRAEQISKHFFSKKTGDLLRAVDDIDLVIGAGESLALVGESGSGKTTFGRLLLALLKPTSGTIFFDGKELDLENKGWLKEFRRRTSVVFQDPFSSLDPHMLVMDIVAEPLDAQGGVSRGKREDKVAKVLRKLGLDESHMYRYPHEFSGGQRQRIAIARAIVNDPDFIVLDEPTSALDVSVQAQVVNHLTEIRKERSISYLLISHDLGLVRYLTERTAVMYLGRIVETAPTEEIFQSPSHPYTQALLSSIPSPDPTVGLPVGLAEGEIPSPLDIPTGCRFHTRCPHVFEKCIDNEPQLTAGGTGDRAVACYLYDWVKSEPRAVLKRQNSG